MVAIGERLDQASAALEGGAIGDPLVVAEMQGTLGDSQLGLGNHSKAIALYEQVRATYAKHLGPDHPQTLKANLSLDLLWLDPTKLECVLFVDELDGNDGSEGGFWTCFADEGVGAAADRA